MVFPTQSTCLSCYYEIFALRLSLNARINIMIGSPCVCAKHVSSSGSWSPLQLQRVHWTGATPTYHPPPVPTRHILPPHPPASPTANPPAVLLSPTSVPCTEHFQPMHRRNDSNDSNDSHTITATFSTDPRRVTIAPCAGLLPR